MANASKGSTYLVTLEFTEQQWRNDRVLLFALGFNVKSVQEVPPPSTVHKGKKHGEAD